MHLPDPTFPPLLSGHGVSAPGRVLPVACDGAERGAFEAGHVIWARNTAIAEFAFVFEPEVDREQAQDMRIVLQTAIADGLGAIMPSQTAIQFGWPDDIIVNGAKVGETCLVVSSRETDAVPAWLVTGVRLVLTRDLEGLEPGLVRNESSIAEEDGADLDRSRIISTVAAHMLNAVQEWGEMGTRPFADRWIGRVFGYDGGAEFRDVAGVPVVHGTPVGAAGGSALMVRAGDNGGVVTVPAPIRAFADSAPGADLPFGAPWV
jgi:BirA family biotin operon repressor/biotin-[acetyl-CoA-carboxylase] ligase